jgi:hypothetical protein
MVGAAGRTGMMMMMMMVVVVVVCILGTSDWAW